MFNKRNYIKYVYEEKEYRKCEKGYYEIDGYKINNNIIEFLINKNICIINKKKELVFKFVGVICIDDIILASLPKHYIPIEESDCSLDEKFNRIVKILKVLRKYPKDKAKFYLGEFFTDDNISDINISEISLADHIIKDFMNNGIYENKNYELDINSGGEINWEYTIEHMQPYFSDSGIIYTDTYGYAYNEDIHNKSRYIHICIVNHCIKKYSKLLSYNISPIDSGFTELEQIGSVDELLGIINTELQSIYNQSKIETLTCIYNFIDKKYNKNNESNYSVFGTTSFEHIWEHIIGEVFLNKKTNYINDEINIIDRPIWVDKEGKENNDNKSTIVPDFIKVEDETLFILDAKYYNMEYKYDGEGNFKVKGNPEIESITKQILYEIILKKRIRQNFSQIKINKTFNAFIYPARNNLTNIYENYGNVRLDIFKNYIIRNIYIDPEVLYEYYLDNKKLSCKLLLS